MTPIKSQRTEDDMLTHAPVVLVLGKKFYQVTPLTIDLNRVWRQKMVALLNDLAKQSNVKVRTIDTFMHGFMGMFFEFPDRLITLICEYDTTIPEAVIRSQATDEEVAIAFGRLLGVAYPFFTLLETMTQLARATTTPAQ